jgi:hypothetical protein
LLPLAAAGGSRPFPRVDRAASRRGVVMGVKYRKKMYTYTQYTYTQ